MNILFIFAYIDLTKSNKFAEQIPIIEKNGLQYVKIDLGQPPQSFNVLINTLESMSWVYSDECQSCFVSNTPFNNQTKSFNLRRLQEYFLQEKIKQDGNLPLEVAKAKDFFNSTIVSGRYNSLISSTSLDKNTNFTIESNDATIEGRLIGEVISLGQSLKGINFSIVEAFKVINGLNLIGSEGVLGLSFSNINGDSLGLISNLKNSGSIERKIFSIEKSNIYIGNYPDEVKQFPYKYSTCNVTYSEGLDEDYRDAWICDLSHISFGESLNFTDNLEIQGRSVFNSASSIIIAPYSFLSLFREKYFNIYFKGIVCNEEEYKKYVYITCELDNRYLSKDTNLIEDVVLVIGGYGLIIPGHKLFSREISLTNNNLKSSNNIAYFNIMFKKINHNLWEIGNLLLNEYVVVYDSEKSQVGFFGENKKNFYKDWLLWWNLQYNSFTSEEHYKLLIIIGISLGAALIMLVMCLVIQSFRDKDNHQKAPLSEELEDKKE